MELAMPEFQWPGIKKPFSSISGGAFFGEHELSFARCSRWGRRAGFYRGQGENSVTCRRSCFRLKISQRARKRSGLTWLGSAGTSASSSSASRKRSVSEILPKPIKVKSKEIDARFWLPGITGLSSHRLPFRVAYLVLLLAHHVRVRSRTSERCHCSLAFVLARSGRPQPASQECIRGRL